MKRYGDAVVLVQKQNDGSLRRLNAIVLASSLHVPTTADRKPLKDEAGAVLAKEEHLDIAYAVPTLVPDGGVLKTRNLDEIFRPAYDVRAWDGTGWTGYEGEPEAQGSGSARYDEYGVPYGVRDKDDPEDAHKEVIADAENSYGQVQQT